MTIWKFNLEITDKQTIRMPNGARILSIQEQNGELCVWAVVDPDEEYVPRKFRIFGEGHTFDLDAADAKFIGTVQCDRLVWHIFAI